MEWWLVNERIKVLVKTQKSWSAHVLSTSPDTPSGPVAFLEFTSFSSFNFKKRLFVLLFFFKVGSLGLFLISNPKCLGVEPERRCFSSHTRGSYSSRKSGGSQLFNHQERVWFQAHSTLQLFCEQVHLSTWLRGETSSKSQVQVQLPELNLFYTKMTWLS